MEPVEIPIDGVLDLHHFDPREVGDLVRQYLKECRRRGILNIRLIHGKGTGTLQRRVHAVLAKLPIVVQFRLGDGSAGGWGATLVQLAPADE